MANAGHKLKEVRQSEGMSAPQLATYSGLSEKTIRDIENEKRPGSKVTWGRVILSREFAMLTYCFGRTKIAILVPNLRTNIGIDQQGM